MADDSDVTMTQVTERMTSKDQTELDLPSDFQFETRYVVLNYLGLVPTSGSSATSLDLTSQSGGSSNWSRSATINTLEDGSPSKAALTLDRDIELGLMHKELSNRLNDIQADGLVEDAAAKAPPGVGEFHLQGPEEDMLPKSETVDSGIHLKSEASAGSGEGASIKRPDSIPLLSAYEREAASAAEAAEGATMESSGDDDVTIPFSEVTDDEGVYADILSIDPTQLEGHEAFTPLKEELYMTYEKLNSEFAAAQKRAAFRDQKRSSGACAAATPVDTVVARRLAIIGDMVQKEFFTKVNSAAQAAADGGARDMTYERFKSIAVSHGLVDAGLVNWTQVALLLRYSQQVLIKLYRRGERGLTDLFSYSTKLVMDVAADFVIREGGWNAISQLDLDSPPTSSDLLPVLESPADDVTLPTSSLEDQYLKLVQEQAEADERPVDESLVAIAAVDPPPAVANGVATVEDTVERLRPDILFLRQASESLHSPRQAQTSNFYFWTFTAFCVGFIGAAAVYRYSRR